MYFHYCFGINTHIDGGVQTVLDRIAYERNLHDRVVSTLETHLIEKVLLVGHGGLWVGIVRCSLLDFIQQVLLNIELTGVRYCAALDGIVREKLGAVVNDGCSCYYQGLVEDEKETYYADGLHGLHSAREQPL